MEGYYKQWLNNHWPVWAARLLWGLSHLGYTKIVRHHKMKDYPVVCFAHWHGDELALITHFGKWELAILVSQSKDGEIMAKGAKWLGYKITRGSSTRGAVGGLIALIKAVRKGDSAVLAVDGPTGPRGVCKPGIIRLAQKTRVPLFPVGVATTRKYVFEKSWNKVYLPLPGFRQVILFDDPLFFPSDCSDCDMEDLCRRTEEALNRAREKARTILDRM